MKTLTVVKPNLTMAQLLAAALLGETPEEFAKNERIEELRRKIEENRAKLSTEKREEYITKEHIELSRLVLTNTKPRRELDGFNASKTYPRVGFKVE